MLSAAATLARAGAAAADLRQSGLGNQTWSSQAPARIASPYFGIPLQSLRSGDKFSERLLTPKIRVAIYRTIGFGPFDCAFHD
jgi:hypothetical protein